MIFRPGDEAFSGTLSADDGLGVVQLFYFSEFTVRHGSEPWVDS